MKLIINYDFVDAIKDANEPQNIYKVARNNKYWGYFWVPIWILMGLKDFNYDIIESLTLAGIDYIALLGLSTGVEKLTGVDRYKMKAEARLKILAHQLQDLNLSTDYELLLKSELYEKKNKIKLNDEKIPYMVQNKYVLVPTYAFNGDIKETSIEQEHVIGSRQYVLSLGKPSVEHSYAYSFN